MKKTITIIISLMVASAALAEQPVSVRKTTSTKVELKPTGERATNTTWTYVFSAPQPVGQLQDSVSYTQANPPSSATVSNDIAARVKTMLGWVRKKEDKIVVAVPQ